MRLSISAVARRSLQAAAVAALFTMSATASQAQSGPFAGMGGSWSGTGTILLENGSERIRCRATYTVDSAGTNLVQELRCASDSYRFDLSTNVTSRGGTLTGTWAEESRGISGGVEGKVSNGNIQALVQANGFAASLSLVNKGKTQSISLSSQNSQLRGVNITLAKS